MSADSSLLEDLIRQRCKKLAWLTSAGVDPYPSSFMPRSPVSALREAGVTPDPQKTQITSGRLMSMRMMGKACFAHIQDATGTIQLYLKRDAIGEESYAVFKKAVDIGDWIGARGTLFSTKTGELTLSVESFVLLAKALRPLPEKWHGLRDVETRFRQRYVDLIVNPAARATFAARSRIIASLRATLGALDFMEVETPQMHTIPGGAIARPFRTHHNALDRELYLRIAPELFLKRLIVGGYERIFEIGRCFRNEGIDTLHNPEFTIIEIYQAWVDYHAMMALTERLLTDAAAVVSTPERLSYRQRQFSLRTPFRRATIQELFAEHAGEALTLPIDRAQLARLAGRHRVRVEDDLPALKLFDRLFDALIAPQLIEPTFVMDFPKEFSPLARRKAADPGVAERFELFIAGEEIANAYSELNDPAEQDRAFRQQRELDVPDETGTYDVDYVRALEYGMPPTGGLGIGIDRLVMLMTGVESIREVVFFPILRKEADPQ